MTQKKSSIVYLAAALSAAFIWGFFSIPLRRLHTYPASEILCYRVFACFIILWLLNLTFRRAAISKDSDSLRNMPAGSRKKLIWLVIFTGIFITGNWFSYIYVVNHIGVKVAAFAYMICPLLTAAGGFLVLKEELTRPKLVALILAVISIIILSTASLTDVLWAMFVGVMYAVYLVIQRVLNQFDKINMLCIQLLISVVLLLPYYISQFRPLPESVSFWMYIVIIAVVFTLLPLLLSMYALNGIPSSTLGITIYINPVITFVVAFFYFNEGIEQSHMAGYLLLFFAVIVFNWQTLSAGFKRKTIEETQLT